LVAGMFGSAVGTILLLSFYVLVGVGVFVYDLVKSRV